MDSIKLFPAFPECYKLLAEELFEAIRVLGWDGEGVTRDGWSPIETACHELVKKHAESRGLQTSRDAMGNLVVELTGHSPTILGTGSHLDSVPEGGNFDGAAGAIGGLLCLLRMADEKITPPNTIKLRAFRCEEGACYGTACIGSRSLFGKLNPKDLDKTHRTTGVTLRENMQSCGADTSLVERSESVLKKEDFHAFVELHIEQASNLEKAGIPVGVVTKIIGSKRIAATITGATGHSGAQPREERRDAVFAFTDFVQRCDAQWKTWLETKREYMTLTVGKVHTDQEAEAYTRVPDKLEFSVEVRAMAIDILEGFWDLVMSISAQVEKDRNVKFTFFDESIASMPVVELTPAVIDHIEHICQKGDFKYQRMASAAGHDSVYFCDAGIPTGMIFIRNQNGSHNKDEAMRIEDFMIGCDVLYHALLNPHPL